MIPIHVLPRADQDVSDAADRYAQLVDIELAARFYDAVEYTWIELATRPLLGSTLPWDSERLRDVRRRPVSPPFGVYQVYYRVAIDRLEVLRVLHGARDGGRILGTRN